MTEIYGSGDNYYVTYAGTMVLYIGGNNFTIRPNILRGARFSKTPGQISGFISVNGKVFLFPNNETINICITHQLKQIIHSTAG